MLIKIGRAIIYFIVAVIGLIIVAACLINTPLSHRYITKKVNSVFAGADIPITIKYISSILPNSVSVDGALLFGKEGDTIVYSEKIEASFVPGSLLHKKVIIRSAFLRNSQVKLLRGNLDEKINIADVFSHPDKPKKKEKKGARWEVSVGSAEIEGLNFRMNDSVSEINIVQTITYLEIKTEQMSLTDKVILVKTLDLLGADGSVSIGNRPDREKDIGKDVASWTFGVKEASLKNVSETYTDSGEKIKVKVAIDEGIIRARNTDMKNRKIDLSKVTLTGVYAEYLMSDSADKSSSTEPFSLSAFPWDIQGSAIDLKDFSFSLGDYPGTINLTDNLPADISIHNLALADIALNSSTLGVRVKEMSVDLNNGFSIRKMKGEVASGSDITSLSFMVETGYSNLNFAGEYNGSLFDILHNPEIVTSGEFSISKSSISLIDLMLFRPELGTEPIVAVLSADPIKIEGNFSLKGSTLSIPDFLISQSPNIEIAINGDIQNPMDPKKATGNIQFRSDDINTGWVNRLMENAGIKTGMPSFSELSIEGYISDSALAPKYGVKIKSDFGDIDLDGSFNLADSCYKLNSGFKNIRLGRILDNSDFGSLTGTADISGQGFNRNYIKAEALFSIDTMHFNGYDYSNMQVSCGIKLPEIDVSFTIDDPSVNIKLITHIVSTDSLTRAHSSGNFEAKLNEINIMTDTVSAGGVFELEFDKTGDFIKAGLAISGISLTTPSQNIHVARLDGSFEADSTRTSLAGSSDFMNFEVHIEEPVGELKRMLAGYRSYVNSFTKPQVYDPSTRVSYLPEIISKINFKEHEAVGIFLKNFHFGGINASIINNPSEGKLEYIINGSDIEFESYVVGTFGTRVTDSAGLLNINLDAENCVAFSLPLSKIHVTSHMGGWQGQTNLLVSGAGGEPLYNLELGLKADTSLIYVSVPSRQMILNGVDWKLDSEEMSRINFDERRIMPNFRMRADDSYLFVTSVEQSGSTQIKFDIGNVNIKSILPENIIKGNPGGILSGTAEVGKNNIGNHQFATELTISDIAWSDKTFRNMEIDADYLTDSTGNYTLSVVTRLDSSEVILDAQKTAGGTGTVRASIKDLPLETTEPFLRKYLSDLQGSLSGNLNISSTDGTRKFNGEIFIREGGLRVNSLNSFYTIPDERIVLKDKGILFDKFTILDSLNHRLIADGSLDFARPDAIWADFEVSSTNLQVMNIDPDENEGFSGNIFVASKLSLKGLLSELALRGSITLTKGTEVFYSRKEDLSLSESEQIITFISDSSVTGSFLSRQKPIRAFRGGISVDTQVDIDPATKVNFNLTQKLYNIGLMIEGGGSLIYNMSENNQMNLSGKYEVGQGTADVKMIGWPNKAFRISPGGYIQWDGNIEDPNLQFEAVNRVRTSYTNPVDGKLRDVDFNVVLKLNERLSELDLVFTVNTPDQYLMSIINTLSPEEQMRQAITVLLFEKIDLPGISTSTNYVTEQVNQMLASQLNALTKTTIKGIDISFGIDSYTTATSSGGEQTKTSLSYDVRKSLLNDRAQIEISGRINDYANQQSSSNMSLNNFSFEYRLDSAATKFVKVYNEHTYEDVFEGEVIKTGVGFIYRKSYKSLRDIWKRDERKKKPKKEAGK